MCPCSSSSIEITEIDLGLRFASIFIQQSYHCSIKFIDIKKVDKLTHAMHVKDRYVNDTFIDKLTK